MSRVEANSPRRARGPLKSINDGIVAYMVLYLGGFHYHSRVMHFTMHLVTHSVPQVMNSFTITSSWPSGLSMMSHLFYMLHILHQPAYIIPNVSQCHALNPDSISVWELRLDDSCSLNKLICMDGECIDPGLQLQKSE